MSRSTPNTNSPDGAKMSHTLSITQIRALRYLDTGSSVPVACATVHTRISANTMRSLVRRGLVDIVMRNDLDSYELTLEGCTVLHQRALASMENS